MSEQLWNIGSAGQMGNFKGALTGTVINMYSVPGMANNAAGAIEVLSQNGYHIYENTDTGRLRAVRDNYPDNSNMWDSQALGVTVNRTGDTTTFKGFDEEEERDDGDVQAALNSFGLITMPNFDYSSYTNDSRSSFALTSQNVLNRLNAAQTSGTTYASTAGLQTDETIDPLTKGVVDKEKSEAIDELTTSETTKHKFDNIAKLIKKTVDKQNKAEVTVTDKTGEYMLSAGSALGVVGAISGKAVGAAAAGLAGKVLGAKVGGALGTLAGPAGTVVGAVVGAAIGAGIGCLIGKATKGSDEAKADSVNNDAAKEAKKAGDELKDALEGLSEEELIAFQRYYYKEYGCKVTDVLKAMETDEDSSKIAQGAGFDSGYLSGMFADIDSANESLKPDDTQDIVIESPNSGRNLSSADAAQIDVLEQNVSLLRDYWQAALMNGGSIKINGETKTADELSQMYIEASRKLDEFNQGLAGKLDQEI